MPYLDANGERLYYEDAGRGPAVVLMHSLGSSSHAWAEQIAHLRNRFRVIAPDCRGHGRSSHNGPVTLDGIVADLAALLDHLGVERVHLGGLSMGGCYALAFYRRSPERVASLILADTFSSLPAGQGRQRVADRAAALQNVAMPDFGRQYAEATLLPATAAEKRVRLAEVVGGMSKEAFLETCEACFLSDAEEVLPAVRVPTLVVWGDRDDRTPRPLSELIARSIPGAELRVIPNAAHLANLDNPAEFNRALDEFLARVEA